MINYIKIARPDHWVKNMFVLPGVVIALLLTEHEITLEKMLMLLAGVFATCMIASANYVINEWLDAEFDKYHPVKRNRPVVCSKLEKKKVYFEYVLLSIIGLLASVFVNKWFFICEFWLLIMGIIYNVRPLRTKDIVYLDVLTESINNLIRFLLGWFIITQFFFPPVSVLFGYWMTGAFLMGVKRFAEYRMIGDSKQAGLYRKSFKYYTERTLLGSSFFYGLCATFFIGIFLIKYKIEYIFTIPFMFVIFSYYLMLAFDKDSVVQRPEKLYRSRMLVVLVSIYIGLFFAVTLMEVPVLHEFQNAYLLAMP